MSKLDNVSAVVAAHWCAALEVNGVAAQDEFFALGGDSLKAAAFVSQVESDLAIQIPLEVLFIEGTYGAVVEACQEAVNALSAI